MNQSSAALNGDLSQRIVVDTSSMDWSPGPVDHVLHKWLHRTGPDESAQLTSLVRYEPGARLPAHDHPREKRSWCWRAPSPTNTVTGQRAAIC
ncbi:cupin domain-containing protein [Kineobactrum salinum]|uniref:cupin domain-containing protein n=1 Tax=Kineobactrum salinum TaxID=2708301 RepID=UPI0018D841D6